MITKDKLARWCLAYGPEHGDVSQAYLGVYPVASMIGLTGTLLDAPAGMIGILIGAGTVEQIGSLPSTLTALTLSSNTLTTLRLGSQPNLTHLDVSANPDLSDLTIRNPTVLTHFAAAGCAFTACPASILTALAQQTDVVLNLANNALTTSSVDAILTALDPNKPGILNLSGNEAPTDETISDALIAGGWTVTL